MNRDPGVLNRFGISGTGTSHALSYGVGEEWASPSLFSNDLGLLVRLEGIYTSGAFDLDSGYTVSGIERKIVLEPRVLWSSNRLFVSGGPWAAFRITANASENTSSGLDITPPNSTSSSNHFGVGASIGWALLNTPIRPELSARLDLTELGNAGVNAWSFGAMVSFPLFTYGTNSSDGAEPEFTTSEVRNTIVPPRVRFLVNRSELNRNVPLERDELRVKEYRMVDSANKAPIVNQWVVQSYHLPHLAVSCEFDRDVRAELTIAKDSQVMDRVTIDRGTTDREAKKRLTVDTVIEMQDRISWQDAFSRLDIDKSNEIRATLAVISTVDSSVTYARDSLILPPVSAANIGQTIVRKQYRFFLSQNFSSIEGGEEALRLLLERIRELADTAHHISVLYPATISESNFSALTARLKTALGRQNSSALYRKEDNILNGMLVVLEL